MGSGDRKYGRKKKKPTQVRYVSSARKQRNKKLAEEREVKRQMRLGERPKKETNPPVEPRGERKTPKKIKMPSLGKQVVTLINGRGYDGIGKGGEESLKRPMSPEIHTMFVKQNFQDPKVKEQLLSKLNPRAQRCLTAPKKTTKREEKIAA